MYFSSGWMLIRAVMCLLLSSSNTYKTKAKMSLDAIYKTGLCLFFVIIDIDPDYYWD